MTHDDTDTEPNDDTAPITIDPFGRDEQLTHIVVAGVSRSGITTPTDASTFEDDGGESQ